MLDRTQLAIKWNNCASNDPCAACGERTDPAVGPELFKENSWKVVCWECGRKYAPDLIAVLTLYRERQNIELAST